MPILHDDQVTVTADQVKALVADQLPQWAHLPVTQGPPGGTDHTLFRLGDQLLARMPKIGWAGEQAVRDARWLPRLAPLLPLELPVPLAIAGPGRGFPYRWSVTRWLPGVAAEPGTFDGVPAARRLAELLVALRAAGITDGPVAQGTARGVALERLDEAVRRAIVDCGSRLDADLPGGGRMDAALVTRVWDQALAARPASGATWIHGDLLPGNLLVHERRLSAVIDWGAIGVGDPAADLVPAWSLFDGEARAVFREVGTAGLADPEDAWARAAGWVVVQAVIGLPYYWDRWRPFALAGRRRLAAVLDDLSR